MKTEWDEATVGRAQWFCSIQCRDTAGSVARRTSGTQSNMCYLWLEVLFLGRKLSGTKQFRIADKAVVKRRLITEAGSMINTEVWVESGDDAVSWCLSSITSWRLLTLVVSTTTLVGLSRFARPCVVTSPVRPPTVSLDLPSTAASCNMHTSSIHTHHKAPTHIHTQTHCGFIPHLSVAPTSRCITSNVTNNRLAGGCFTNSIKFTSYYSTFAWHPITVKSLKRNIFHSMTICGCIQLSVTQTNCNPHRDEKWLPAKVHVDMDVQ